MALSRCSLLVLLALSACASPLEPSTAPDPEVVEAIELTPLEPVALLSRISIDLRGVRPSIAEVTAVQELSLIHI